MVHSAKTPLWSWALPILGILLFGATTVIGFGEDFASRPESIALAVLAIPLLIGAVFAAVYHAEEIAHATGEPFGTLVLTIAVTVIELALILSLMATGKASPTLVRDTVFAVVMIIVCGLVGLCIVVGGLRYRQQRFDVTSAKIYLAVLIVLVTLTTILPNYTHAAPEGLYSFGQLAFISVSILALYGVFLYTQTVLHRDYFTGDFNSDASPPTGGKFFKSLILLCLALTTVVVLAKLFAILANVGVASIGAPPGVTGVLIALIVLTPEAISAVRAASRDDLQKSVNLALGSSLATISLTVPAIAFVNIFQQVPLVLGLEPRDVTLLAMTLAASILTFGTGRTNVLFGFLHLVMFGTFMFLAFVP
ncbi:ionic transporter y4hA [Hyphomicrobium methylovorum]|uniref:calcium:proton antiporter n=1 Tax=Hyphomicrobium methylovorum TaxID=84 RepID=UPI0015E6CE93|nr:ionic transporter y4hA [Hyphomicrobium methylovorum]MBA2126532.1 ionic transporter y4hA [Hyphomicrobium methylovorum]